MKYTARSCSENGFDFCLDVSGRRVACAATSAEQWRGNTEALDAFVAR